MTPPTFLVTAAAGKTGRATAELLLSQGHRVRALVHREDARSAALRSAGADVRIGSLEDWEDLSDCLRGVQRAYFCPPLEPGTLRRATLFAAAAREANVEVVVALSQWLVDPLHLSVHAREKWLSEEVFRWMPGVSHIIVNPGWFADNYMAALEPICLLGVMALPLGEGRNAPPSNEDIARVIAGALVRPEPWLGQRLRPTGPTLLSPPDIAAAFGRVLGRKVAYREASMGLFLKVARAMGLSDFVIRQLHAFLLDYQRGSFAAGAPTEVVREVGGRAAESFEDTARRYLGASRLRPGWRGTASALWNVLRGLAARAPDLAAIDGRLALPRVEHARLAADSARWREASLRGA